MKLFNSVIWIALLSTMLGVNSYAATSLMDEDTANNEPPVIKAMLEQANALEFDEKNTGNTWQAANLYCEATRLGSSESAYRLGMLYVAGRGVPVSRDYAASLFSIAANKGHVASQKMLENLEVKTTDVPQCVLEAVAPEKIVGQSTVMADAATQSQGVNLPKNKHWATRFVDTISAWYKVDPQLVLSMIAVESNAANGENLNKVSQGLMRLPPDSTAGRFNANLNIKEGVAYLRWLLTYFKGDVTLALAAYNAGEDKVTQYKGVPPFAKTKQYVKNVQTLYPLKQHPYEVPAGAASYSSDQSPS